MVNNSTEEVFEVELAGEFSQDFRHDDRIVVDTEHRSCGRVAHQIYHDALLGKQAIYRAEVLGDKGQIFGAELQKDLVFLQDEVRYWLWAVYTTNGSSGSVGSTKLLMCKGMPFFLRLNGFGDDRGAVKANSMASLNGKASIFGYWRRSLDPHSTCLVHLSMVRPLYRGRKQTRHRYNRTLLDRELWGVRLEMSP